MGSQHFFKSYFEEVTEALNGLDPKELEQAAVIIQQAHDSERKVILAGNGGSAAMASHVAVDLTKTAGIRAINFNEADLLTCLANDYGYDNTFTRQVDTFVKPKDLVVAFSTSGKSKNVVKALQLAKEKGAVTVGFTGSSAGSFPGICDICIRVPSENTPRIQESHLAVIHIICELLEKELT